MDPSASPVDDPLTEFEEAFVEEYFRQGFCATRAYRELRPDDKFPNQYGWKLLKKPNVNAAIRARTAERRMEADEVIAQYTELARVSLADVFVLQSDGKTVVFDVAKAWKTGAIHYIKKLKRDSDGSISVELPDKRAVLRDLAQIYDILNAAISNEPGESATGPEIHIYVPDNGRRDRRGEEE